MGRLLPISILTLALSGCELLAPKPFYACPLDTAEGGCEPADEVCDGVDQDCDGLVDEGFDVETWYRDSDGDGYGDAEDALSSCEPAPSGYVGALDADADGAEDFDCDDADDGVNPSAIEICGDGIDNDCDGEAPSCEVDLADAGAKLTGESDGDGAGGSVSGGQDVDGDGAPDLLIGALLRDAERDGGEDDGAAYLIYGPVSGERALSEADVWFVGEDRAHYAGDSVALVGDTDGDRFADLLIGARGYGDGAGAAYLIPGGGRGLAGEVSLSDVGFLLLGDDGGDGGTGSSAGFAVAGAGDANGDGYDDLLIGAPTYDTFSGAVHLVHGPVSADLDLLDDADATLRGEAYTVAGIDVAGAGDVDGDGADDLLIGTGWYNSGSVAYLALGGGSGSGSLSDSEALWISERDLGEDLTFWLVAGLGDVNGDGYADVAVADPLAGADGAGEISIFLGPVEGERTLSEHDDATLSGEEADDLAGWEVAGLGDADGDGYGDLLIGAPQAATDGRTTGAAYVVLGPVSNALSLSEADSRFAGEADGDYAGEAVSGAGDADGDGSIDLLIGAPFEDAGGVDAGAAYLAPAFGG